MRMMKRCSINRYKYPLRVYNCTFSGNKAKINNNDNISIAHTNHENRPHHILLLLMMTVMIIMIILWTISIIRM